MLSQENDRSMHGVLAKEMKILKEERRKKLSL